MTLFYQVIRRALIMMMEKLSSSQLKKKILIMNKIYNLTISMSNCLRVSYQKNTVVCKLHSMIQN